MNRTLVVLFIIIVVIAVVILCSCCCYLTLGVGFTLLPTHTATVQAVVQATKTVRPTSTQVPTSTPRPTHTPQPTRTLQPTTTPKIVRTPLPTVTPIPGWKKFAERDMELWLPESYEGGDPSTGDLQVIIERLKALGPEFERMVSLVEQNPSMFVLWAFDTEVGDSALLTNVMVIAEPVPSAVTLDLYLALGTKNLPKQFHVVEQGKVSLGYYEAGRLVVEATMFGISAKELIYVIKGNNAMWNVTYSTGANEFDQRLPVFEQSIRTFRIQPQDD